MHPKTFQLSVRRPLASYQGYFLYLHASDWRQALAKLSALLPGVDIAQTVARYEGRLKSDGVGNSDPVLLMDCDAFGKCKFVAGRRVTVAQEPGEFRRCADEVAASLLQVFHRVQEDREGLYRSFEAMAHHYPDLPSASKYAQMVRIKDAAEMALVWQNNLWAEYSRMQAPKAHELKLPEPVHATAAW